MPGGCSAGVMNAGEQAEHDRRLACYCAGCHCDIIVWDLFVPDCSVLLRCVLHTWPQWARQKVLPACLATPQCGNCHGILLSSTVGKPHSSFVHACLALCRVLW